MSSTLTTQQTLAGTRSFRDVSPETLAHLISESQEKTLPGGSTLFRPGQEYKQRIYIMLEGNIVMHRPSGRQDSVQPGDFVGLANYLDKHNYTAKAVATTHSRVLELTEEAMKSLEQDHPDLFNALNRVIAAKLRERSPDRSISTGILAQPVTRVMKTPVASCGPETTIEEAYNLMEERKIGSLVVIDHKNRLKGVLTFSGLAEAAIFHNAQPGDSVMEVACEVPRVIDTDTALWEAEEIQQRYNVKYLIVVDEEKPIGMVSQSDILRVLISRPSTLTNRFRDADSIKELAGLTRGLTEAAFQAQETNHRPSDAVRLLSETHLVVQRRAIQLTLRWMETKGYGPPPADYAILIMGSGGRKEMLLNPDQDNGIIIEDGEESAQPEVQEWFDRFCKRINRNLDRVNYELCPGEIMARNPMYRKTLSEWKKQITHITSKPTEKAARWSNVVLDFDTLYGNDALTAELRHHALRRLEKKPRLLKMMVEDDAEGKPAIGFFNQLITTTSNEQGQWIDIKRNGLRIIADAARIYALHNGVAVQNTSDRLDALVRIGKLSKDFRDSIQEAFEELLDLLLTHQIKQARQGETLDKLIDPEKLSRQSRSTLRMAMRAVKRFQEQLQEDYETDIF
jgi:CBS domain-containing protein